LIKNIEAAREKITFATTMFNLGRASNLDVTDAQKDLLQAEVDYAVELAEYYIEQARLEQLLGGHSIINLKP
jgi:outer membrane protein TolC